jgi:hypothetical protein
MSRRGDRLARGARTVPERRWLARPKTMPIPTATATASGKQWAGVKIFSLGRRESYSMA